ncbi:type IV toxin-antitoxin system AbiEi family antitoxin domain-containing protein [bacterium]|nr:type IV toxin-antitoxin system AbiEi family antitoxin domain-containing protein [bacterium]
MANRDSRIKKAEAVFRELGGVLRTGQALDRGIHPRDLYAMADTGRIERLSRGVYRLADRPPLGNPDLVTVSKRIPQGVICMVSALAFHGITTQIPHEIHVAVDRKAWASPRIDSPPVRVFRYTGPAFTEGIEEHRIDKVVVRVYGPEKTIADVFKFRNKIGLDVALEALRLAKAAKNIRVPRLLEFARICRVERVMRPYLEAIL